MKRVVILSANSRISNFLTHPIRRAKQLLLQRGYSVALAYRPSPRRLASDILCLSSRHCAKWWGRGPEVVPEFIRRARSYASKIIWLDDQDSTSTTHFQLLPHVDLYLKKQLLKDRTLYTAPLHGDRLFTDFYHREFGVVDDEQHPSHPLDLSLAHKVHLSWHIGLGDMAGDILPRPVKWLREKLPPTYPRRFTPVDQPRPIDVMFRGSRNYSRNTVAFHRQKMGKILDNMDGLNAALKGFVSIRQYLRETQQSKLVPSPFGWGEIGVRDFQAWMYGAALMKPDMSHMETWPDVFRPMETYYPIHWNFDNLESGIRELLEDQGLRLSLAQAGQEAYVHMVSEKGMEEFADWFVQQVER